MSSTSDQVVKVFVTGVTGYIGGTALHLLLNRGQVGPRFHFTALVRTKDAAAKVATLSNDRHTVTPLVGSLDDSDLLADAADAADLVLHFAHADHLPAIDAITRGLIRRTTEGSKRKRGILIHTSGTGQLTTNDKGELGLHSIPITQMHRDVDSLIFERAGGSGDDAAFDSIIVSPCTIWGRGLGVFNRSSLQIPILIRGFAAHRRAFTVGPSLNRWDQVNVEDLARLYALLVDKALDGTADTGREGGWYFAENGHYVQRDVIARIAEVLHRRGAIDSAQLTPFEDDAHAERVLGGYWSIFGTTSKSSADRSRRLGWQPRYGTADMLADIEHEVEAILSETKASA